MRLTLARLRSLLREALQGPQDDVSLDDAIEEIVGMMPDDLVIDVQASDTVEGKYQRHGVPVRLVIVGPSRALAAEAAEGSTSVAATSRRTEELMRDEADDLLVNTLGYRKGANDQYDRGNNMSAWIKGYRPLDTPRIMIDVRADRGQ